MKRSALTLSLYATYGCLGYILAGLGAILPELRAERDLPRVEAALYPSGFALGLIVVGLFGPRVAGRLGRFAVPAALACLTGGTALLAAGSGRLDSGFGALSLGLGGAGLVLVVPAKLRAAHGDASTVALTEANAVSSAGSVLAPLLVGAALATGLGWRAGFAGVPLLAALVVLAFLLGSKHRVAEPAPCVAADAEPGSGRAEGIPGAGGRCSSSRSRSSSACSSGPPTACVRTKRFLPTWRPALPPVSSWEWPSA